MIIPKSLGNPSCEKRVRSRASMSGTDVTAFTLSLQGTHCYSSAETNVLYRSSITTESRRNTFLSPHQSYPNLPLDVRAIASISPSKFTLRQNLADLAIATHTRGHSLLQPTRRVDSNRVKVPGERVRIVIR